jgi:hypothetical protein
MALERDCFGTPFERREQSFEAKNHHSERQEHYNNRLFAESPSQHENQLLPDNRRLRLNQAAHQRERCFAALFEDFLPDLCELVETSHGKSAPDLISTMASEQHDRLPETFGGLLELILADQFIEIRQLCMTPALINHWIPRILALFGQLPENCHEVCHLCKVIPECSMNLVRESTNSNDVTICLFSPSSELAKTIINPWLMCSLLSAANCTTHFSA